MLHGQSQVSSLRALEDHTHICYPFSGRYVQMKLGKVMTSSWSVIVRATWPCHAAQLLLAVIFYLPLGVVGDSYSVQCAFHHLLPHSRPTSLVDIGYWRFETLGTKAQGGGTHIPENMFDMFGYESRAAAQGCENWRCRTL